MGHLISDNGWTIKDTIAASAGVFGAALLLIKLLESVHRLRVRIFVKPAQLHISGVQREDQFLMISITNPISSSQQVRFFEIQERPTMWKWRRLIDSKQMEEESMPCIVDGFRLKTIGVPMLYAAAMLKHRNRRGKPKIRVRMITALNKWRKSNSVRVDLDDYPKTVDDYTRQPVHYANSIDWYHVFRERY